MKLPRLALLALLAPPFAGADIPVLNTDVLGSGESLVTVLYTDLAMDSDATVASGSNRWDGTREFDAQGTVLQFSHGFDGHWEAGLGSGFAMRDDASDIEGPNHLRANATSAGLADLGAFVHRRVDLHGAWALQPALSVSLPTASDKRGVAELRINGTQVQAGDEGHAGNGYTQGTLSLRASNRGAENALELAANWTTNDDPATPDTIGGSADWVHFLGTATRTRIGVSYDHRRANSHKGHATSDLSTSTLYAGLEYRPARDLALLAFVSDAQGSEYSLVNRNTGLETTLGASDALVLSVGFQYLAN